MLSLVGAFFMKYKNKNVLIVGYGESGKSSQDFLLNHKANVFLYDDNKQVFNSLKFDNKKVTILEKYDEEIIKQFDLVVLSPGVSKYSEIIKLAHFNKIPVISELQLGLDNIKGKVIAVTGTNGKTTTVNLLEQVFNYAHKKNYMVGNVGNPITKFVSPFRANYLAEVSSFQLESTEMKPNIACVLNVTPNHLDRHFSFSEYMQTKFKIFKNMTSHGTLVLNYDDENLKKLQTRKVEILDNTLVIKPKIMWFSVKEEVDGAFLKGGTIYCKQGNKITEICKQSDIKLLGIHNVSNVLAVICMAISAKIKLNYIKKAIQNFRGVEHRIEFVKTVDGVDYINDSKSTTPQSTITAINSTQKPKILILGGSSKGLNYDDFVKEISGKIKFAVLTGEIAPELEKSFKKTKNKNYSLQKKFCDAVQKAIELAECGDVVLLSPATASFDEFSNYEQRGEVFMQIVNEL